MYGLSIRRPYANMIVAGVKGVENRRNRPPREAMTRDDGWIVVHGAASWAKAALVVAHRALDQPFDTVAAAWPTDLPGGYLGVAHVAGFCVGRPEGGCRCGPWAVPGFRHWVIDRVAGFDAPIPGPGRLGTWPVPHIVERAARAAVKEAS